MHVPRESARRRDLRARDELTDRRAIVEEQAGDASELPTGWASWSSTQLLALVDCGDLLDDDADLVITELALRSTSIDEG